MTFPNLLNPGDAVNLIVVAYEMCGSVDGEAKMDDFAEGVARLMEQNASAVRYATGTTGLAPQTASMLIERAAGRPGNIEQAIRFIASARMHLYGDTDCKVDFATPQTLDVLIYSASILLLTLDIAHPSDEATESDPVPDSTNITWIQRHTSAVGGSVH